MVPYIGYMTASSRKIEDNRAELDLMMQDLAQAPEVYRPTHHWQLLEPVIYSWLESHSLNDFRALDSQAMRPFAGGSFVTDLSKYTDGSFFRRAVDTILAALSARFPKLVAHPSRSYLIRYENDIRTIITVLWNSLLTEMYPGKLPEISDSKIGNPFDVVTVGSQDITISLIRNLARYLYVDSKVDFQTLKTVLELGGGSGSQIEVNLRLSPHLKYMICDLPPQLYIAQQYLQAAFPGAVMPYSSSRTIESFEGNEFDAYSIVCIAPWQIPMINFKFDLFWTANSFQEMEPDVVRNYCEFVNKFTQSWVYLLQKKEGQQKVESGSNSLGSMAPPTMEHYVRYLNSFELVDLTPALRLPDPTKSPIHHMLFKRITHDR